ncbi:hypothetical protein AAULR_26661, partial [Lacticaseibacillus rhamnosus MTCC 5462]
ALHMLGLHVWAPFFKLKNFFDITCAIKILYLDNDP